jgi:ABC-type amino acid transport substrate-binding protein
MHWLITRLPGLTLAALAILPFLPARAQGVTTIRTAAQTDSEPKFVAAGYHGEPVVEGLCIDIFHAIEKIDGNLSFRGDQSWLPSARIDAHLQAGLLDAACGMIRTAQRAREQQLVEPALFSMHYVLLARADDTAAINDWQDIIRLGNDNVVLSMNGTGPSHQLSTIPALRVDAGSASVQQNIHKLLARRGRFFYFRLPAAHPVIRSYCAQRQIRVLPAVMPAVPAYMMIGRHVPAATSRRIESALRKLKESGELARIAHKWNTDNGSLAYCMS